jgi:hypothetical protein
MGHRRAEHLPVLGQFDPALYPRAMPEGDWWACPACRSLNSLPAGKCYSCRAKRPARAKLASEILGYSVHVSRDGKTLLQPRDGGPQPTPRPEARPIRPPQRRSIIAIGRRPAPGSRATHSLRDRVEGILRSRAGPHPEARAGQAKVDIVARPPRDAPVDPRITEASASIGPGANGDRPGSPLMTSAHQGDAEFASTGHAGATSGGRVPLADPGIHPPRPAPPASSVSPASPRRPLAPVPIGHLGAPSPDPEGRRHVAGADASPRPIWDELISGPDPRSTAQGQAQIPEVAAIPIRSRSDRSPDPATTDPGSVATVEWPAADLKRER